MSIRRLPFGLRPSSAYALSTRPSVQWTPDFTAGAAGLELETILNRFHLGYRTTAVVSGGLKLIARPEDILCRRSAWGALALETADATYLWRRTRRWQSLLEPWVSSVDSIVGVAAVTLGSRAMHVQAQIDGTAWTNRILTVRVAAVPLGDRRGRQLLAGIGIQLLPHFAWQPPGGRRRILVHSLPPLASAFTQSLLISSSMRRKARVIDARALRWAGEELDAALVAEETAFRDGVLGPAPAALAEIAALLTTDRAAAVGLAAAEEGRVRAWLSHGTHRPPIQDDRSAQLAVVEAGVRRLGRRILGGVRMMSSVGDVIEIGRRSHTHPGAARLTGAAITARGLVGAGLATDVLPRLVGDRTTNRIVSAADIAVIVASGIHQVAERHDPPIAAWVERLVYEVAATSGAQVGAGRGLGPVHTAMSAIRAIVAATESRPTHQRVASAANEALIVQATAHQLRQVFETSLDQARRLTTASLNLDDHWTELDDLRVRHRAFVHDGIAQVLTAVAAGEHDDRSLQSWLDQERVRIDARSGRTTTGHARDLAATLETLVDEFAERDILLLTETSDLPDWTASVGGTVGEVIREAVNNVVKHTTSTSAWCGVLHQDDGTVLVRICDFATDFPVFRPGSGTGTATMISLARIIDADIEWFQTRTGGTEVRILLRDSADRAAPHSSVRS